MMLLQVHITWEAIGAMSAVVLPVAGVAVGYMRLAMSNSIRGLKLDIIREMNTSIDKLNLNGTYMRRGECALVHDSLEPRVDALEKSAAILAKAAEETARAAALVAASSSEAASTMTAARRLMEDSRRHGRGRAAGAKD